MPKQMQNLPFETYKYSLCSSENYRYVFLTGGKKEERGNYLKVKQSLDTVIRLDLLENIW